MAHLLRPTSFGGLCPPLWFLLPPTPSPTPCAAHRGGKDGVLQHVWWHCTDGSPSSAPAWSRVGAFLRVTTKSSPTLLAPSERHAQPSCPSHLGHTDPRPGARRVWGLMPEPWHLLWSAAWMKCGKLSTRSQVWAPSCLTQLA